MKLIRFRSLSSQRGEDVASDREAASAAWMTLRDDLCPGSRSNHRLRPAASFDSVPRATTITRRRSRDYQQRRRGSKKVAGGGEGRGGKLQLSDRQLPIRNRGDTGAQNFNLALKFPQN